MKLLLQNRIITFLRAVKFKLEERIKFKMFMFQKNKKDKKLRKFNSEKCIY